MPEEQVMTLAYPAGRPRLVGGRFVRLGDGGKLAGMRPLEMYEGENRLVIDHGTSGALVTRLRRPGRGPRQQCAHPEFWMGLPRDKDFDGVGNA